MKVYEDFSAPLAPRWNRYVVGGGALVFGDGARFILRNVPHRRYANAQIDDYQGLPRRRFPWRPPLRLTVRARFSHPPAQLPGTAGFGFWNDPFLMTGARIPTLPRAVWFFYASPPSNMKLDLYTPGSGWKAATVDALHPSAVALGVCSPLLIPLMNIRPLYHRWWPAIRRILKVRETTIHTDMTDWHTYTLEWGLTTASFYVDGESVLAHAPAPRGPLGFVMWLDNQYLIATPQGRFRWGVLDVPGPRWMAVEWFSITGSGADGGQDEH